MHDVDALQVLQVSSVVKKFEKFALLVCNSSMTIFQSLIHSVTLTSTEKETALDNRYCSLLQVNDTDLNSDLLLFGSHYK